MSGLMSRRPVNCKSDAPYALGKYWQTDKRSPTMHWNDLRCTAWLYERRQLGRFSRLS